MQLKLHLYVNTPAPFKNQNRSFKITKHRFFLKQESSSLTHILKTKWVTRHLVFFSSDMIPRSLPDINYMLKIV